MYAKRSLALTLFVITLWVTEVIPIWATALMIPILVVWGKTVESASASSLADYVYEYIFSNTVFLALGAFTMSAALTKYQLSDRLAHMILSRVGRKPWVICLTVMFVGLFLCMFVSNVAAPTVCLSVIRPILNDLPVGDPYVK